MEFGSPQPFVPLYAVVLGQGGHIFMNIICVVALWLVRWPKTHSYCRLAHNWPCSRIPLSLSSPHPVLSSPLLVTVFSHFQAGYQKCTMANRAMLLLLCGALLPWSHALFSPLTSHSHHSCLQLVFLALRLTVSFAWDVFSARQHDSRSLSGALVGGANRSSSLVCSGMVGLWLSCSRLTNGLLTEQTLTVSRSNMANAYWQTLIGFTDAPIIMAAVTIFALISYFVMPESAWLPRERITHFIDSKGASETVQEVDQPNQGGPSHSDWWHTNAASVSEYDRHKRMATPLIPLS